MRVRIMVKSIWKSFVPRKSQLTAPIYRRSSSSSSSSSRRSLECRWEFKSESCYTDFAWFAGPSSLRLLRWPHVVFCFSWPMAIRLRGQQEPQQQQQQKQHNLRTAVVHRSSLDSSKPLPQLTTHTTTAESRLQTAVLVHDIPCRSSTSPGWWAATSWNTAKCQAAKPTSPVASLLLGIILCSGFAAAAAAVAAAVLPSCCAKLLHSYCCCTAVLQRCPECLNSWVCLCCSSTRSTIPLYAARRTQYITSIHQYVSNKYLLVHQYTSRYATEPVFDEKFSEPQIIKQLDFDGSSSIQTHQAFLAFSLLRRLPSPISHLPSPALCVSAAGLLPRDNAQSCPAHLLHVVLNHHTPKPATRLIAHRTWATSKQ